MAAALASEPDVALLDIEMPGSDRARGGRSSCAASCPACRVLILTTFGRPGYLRRAMEERRRRASCSRTRRPSELAGAIRRAVAGERVVDPGLAAAALSQGESPLTAREHEVLRAVARSTPRSPSWRGALYLSPGPSATTSRR